MIRKLRAEDGFWYTQAHYKDHEDSCEFLKDVMFNDAFQSVDSYVLITDVEKERIEKEREITLENDVEDAEIIEEVE